MPNESIVEIPKLKRPSKAELARRRLAGEKLLRVRANSKPINTKKLLTETRRDLDRAGKQP